MRGHFAEAERLLDEADAVAAASGDPNGPAMAGMFRVSHAWTSMRPDQLTRGRADVLRVLAARGFADDRILSVIVDVGLTVNRDEARALLRRLPFERYHPRFNGQHLMAFLLARADQTDALPVIYERLQSWASRFPFAAGCHGSYSAFLALLAEAMGRREEARRHFAHALAENRRIGARPRRGAGRGCVRALPGQRGRRRGRSGGAAGRGGGDRARAGDAGVAGAARGGGGGGWGAQRRAARRRRPRWPPTQRSRWRASTGRWSTPARPSASKTARPSRSSPTWSATPEGSSTSCTWPASPQEAEGGEVLLESSAAATPDAEARALYRERVEDLRATLAEAESNGDIGRAERAREELDFIADELSRGTGLGGRERASGSSAERARINIQRRIANAIKKIGEASPALGRRLGRGIRTGAYCAWEDR